MVTGNDKQSLRDKRGIVFDEPIDQSRHGTSENEELRQKAALVELSHEPILVWDLDAGILEWKPGCGKTVWLYTC